MGHVTGILVITVRDPSQYYLKSWSRIRTNQASYVDHFLRCLSLIQSDVVCTLFFASSASGEQHRCSTAVLFPLIVSLRRMRRTSFVIVPCRLRRDCALLPVGMAEIAIERRPRDTDGLADLRDRVALVRVERSRDATGRER